MNHESTTSSVISVAFSNTAALRKVLSFFGPICELNQYPKYLAVEFMGKFKVLISECESDIEFSCWLKVPTSVSGVPSNILDPAALWSDSGEYNHTLGHLADLYEVHPFFYHRVL